MKIDPFPWSNPREDVKLKKQQKAAPPCLVMPGLAPGIHLDAATDVASANGGGWPEHKPGHDAAKGPAL